MAKPRFLRKATLLLVFITLLGIFAYGRRQVLFQEAKKLIKQNLEKRFPCEVSIGDIRAGLVRGVVVEDIVLNFSANAGTDFKVKLDQALLDYNLWGHAFGKIRKHEEPEKVVLNLKGGEVFLSGKQPVLKDLEGSIILENRILYLRDIKASLAGNSQDTFKLYGELSEERLSLTANLNHLIFGEFDLLTNLSLDANKKLANSGESENIYGVFRSYGSVLNNKPLPELSSFFELQDKYLRLISLSLGESYDLRGIIGLSSPHTIDLSLNFYQAALNELIDQFSFGQPADFCGLTNGFIKVTGELPRPKVEGYLASKEGHLGKLDFLSTEINLKGRYPRIQLVDSHIWREETSFILEGDMDFSKTGACGLIDFLDIRFVPDKSIVWQGWGISRGAQDQVHASKSISDDVAITFDSLKENNGNNSDFEDDYRNELGLEYKFQGDKAIKLRLRGEEEILGLERRTRF